MKKTMVWVLAAVFLLTACGKNGAEQESTEATKEVIEMTEESADVVGCPTAPADHTDADETEADENAESEVKTVPLNVKISAKYEGEWDDQGPIITADSATIHILDEGYETLKNNLKVYNDMNWQEVFSSYIEHREYASADLYPEGTELYISRNIEVKRADNRILSFVNTESSYVGGAHGNYYENAEVFDTQKGKVLELNDVVTDYDKVYQYVMKYLKENYDEERFFEDYEEWLEEMFYEPDGAMASPIEWFYTMEGIEFVFNPYVISPWVSGTIRVELPYEGNETLFVEDYVSHVERPIMKVMSGEKFTLDADQDGFAETYLLTAVPNEEMYSTKLTITKYLEENPEVPGEYEGRSDREFEFWGTFQCAYVVTDPDGHVYLYAEFLGDSDFQTMEVFDLSAVSGEEGKETELAEDIYIEATGNATYGHFISDSDQFALYSRVYTLGTYLGYKTYSVGKDGLPVSEDPMYNLLNEGMEWEISLTSSRPLKVQMQEKGGDGLREETLPKGTVFYPRKTDGGTVMEMELEDGRICNILLEKSPESGAYLINGVKETDCFENLPYAG